MRVRVRVRARVRAGLDAAAEVLSVGGELSTLVRGGVGEDSLGQVEAHLVVRVRVRGR